VSRTAATAALVAVMVALIVTLDVAFFRHHFWPRLMLNAGIVLIFGAVALRFVRRS
jgi:hypothetical protein